MTTSDLVPLPKMKVSSSSWYKSAELCVEVETQKDPEQSKQLMRAPVKDIRMCS